MARVTVPVFMRGTSLISLALLAAGLAACASDKLVGRPGLTIVHDAELPPPTRADASGQRRAYRIAPGDKLNIVTYGISELSPKEVLVDTQGNIGIPLAGTLQAADRTPAELAQQIAVALRAHYVRAPEVTVDIFSTAQAFTVDGDVKEPGIFPVIGHMTLIRAVASAKGLSDFANTNYVVIFRDVGGQKMAALYDLRAIRQGIYDDPEVYPNDVITVGESASRRAFPTLVQGASLLVTPIVALLR